MAPVLKTGEALRVSVGSNPTPSATSTRTAPASLYVVEASAALLIEAASVSTYRLVSDRVISQPIPDSGPDTVSARSSSLRRGPARRRAWR